MDKKIEYRLIIGLGNPGTQYALTYHNVGQLTTDRLIKTAAETMTLIQNGSRKNFEYFKFVNGHSLIFIKPLTCMNESGKAVASSLKHFGIKPKEALIIHDDSDIELGKSKFSFGRGAAGHHGIESIINNLKTKNFWRLRIGIRHKTRMNADQNTDKRGLNISINQRKSLPAGRQEYKSAPERKKAGEMVLKKITAADNLILEKIIKELKI